jgi:hypothetical protein
MVVTQESNTHITSPNFPKPYPPNSDCTWKIIAPKDAKIQLKLKGYHLDDRYAYIQINAYNLEAVKFK